jgi:nuclear pore complex protein Nup205
MIRTLGWQTLFNSLVVYEQRFRQCLQTAGAFLPPFQEGDARALEAYLKVLMRVMEMGNEMERSQWFPDIGPLFKLLSYENVPPYLKVSCSCRARPIQTTWETFQTLVSVCSV